MFLYPLESSLDINEESATRDSLDTSGFSNFAACFSRPRKVGVSTFSIQHSTLKKTTSFH